MKSYTISEQVVTARHYFYRCTGCRPRDNRQGSPRWWMEGWIKQEVTAASLLQGIDRGPFEGRQHYELERHTGCMGYLKSPPKKSTEVLTTVPVKLALEDWRYGREYLADLARYDGRGAPVIAVMWCDQSTKWFVGRARSTQPANLDALDRRVSGPILEREKAKVTDADSYGVNCAEVACVLAAYRGGRQRPNLSGCTFLATRVGPPAQPLNACKSCRAWIADLGGKWRAVKDGKFTLP